jgi:hypothetical protein
MDSRERAVGERLAAEPEPWLMRYLGVPPREAGALRDDYVARAGRAGFYRELRGITDPHAGIGERPSGDPEAGAAWDRSAGALELPAEEMDVRTVDRGELETRVRVHERERAAAPADVGADLQAARESKARAERMAEEARAEGDIERAESLQAVAGEDSGRGAELTQRQAVRDEWDQRTAPTREAARSAQQELTRRGVEPETARPATTAPATPEPEPLAGSLGEALADMDRNIQALGAKLDAEAEQREALREAYDAHPPAAEAEAEAEADTSWAPAARVDPAEWEPQAEEIEAGA